ncbi:hypothetical protein GS966_01225 [Rhodococcus hoagii]|nr:hypothetical protein [Prescottella equi]NKS74585.1 hypothetical protein [Prescottella equi]NKZ88555.1 hypothetical protein [Prescottella equi]
MLNRGFFSKVYIDEDGSVSDGEIQEPFAHILAHLNTVFIDKRKGRVRHILGDAYKNSSEPAPTTCQPARSLLWQQKCKRAGQRCF